ncbi:hypothetical protein F5Y10DRAFT_180376 [Nemania abortiva]|nr:hypothetical protein F5Y10DRAFT_180376 [Nemania abortiva]
MRLACVANDQKILELDTVLKTNPSAVRSLLSAALFECVRTRYPDTIDHLLAERSIRDALHAFPGRQERQVTAYVLTRALDPRVNPARVRMIQQAFLAGGPVALAGVFFATIDSHRNVQNRETLDYLARMDEPARLELFLRAGRFPCGPGIGVWLARLLDKLDLDSKDLAGLLLCLGQDILPTALFEHARLPSRTWGEDGEVVDTPSNVPLLIRNERRFAHALQTLIQVGLASTEGKVIYVRDSFRAQLGDWGQSLHQREQAVRLVSHSFPKHKTHHGDEYISLCHGLLPAFRHIIAYLPSIMASRSSMYQVTEACLSASRFLDEAWKRKVVGIGQYAADRSGSTVLSARAALRRLAIERMYGECKGSPNDVPFPQTSQQPSLFFVEAICLRAQQYVDLGLLASAHGELSRCSVTASTTPALLGRVQQQEITYMRAKVYRFEGQFAAARDLLVNLVGQQSHLAGKATFHLSAVECELGHVEQAMATLEARLEQVHLRPEECRDRARSRLELALANAQLMQVLFQVRDRRLSWYSHPALRDSYIRCLASPPARANGISTVLSQISIAAALAILAHLRGDFDTALAEWNRTLELARGRGVLGQYIELLVAYSTLDLRLRRGGVDVADLGDLEDKVRTLSAQTGRQYHFVGLGTTWPDILGGWREDRGRGHLSIGIPL